MKQVTYLLISCALLAGCKKFLNVGAPTVMLAQSNVYTSDATAANVLTGVYTTLAVPYGGLPTAANTYLGCAADEMVHLAGVNDGIQYYYNNQVTLTTSDNDFWGNTYNQIYTVNAAIEGLQSATQLTPAVKTHLLGESYFLRAYFYFYLVNWFGDVPLALTTDYTVNNQLRRTSADSVYSQIVADLTQAQNLLIDDYVYADGETVTTDRTRPNKATATALLARVYLYTKQYGAAITSASALIGNTAAYQIESFPNVYLKQSREAIWQLQPVLSGRDTWDAYMFTLPSSGPSGGYPFYLSKNLLNSFYPGDLRYKNWVDSVSVDTATYYYPAKYKQGGVYNPLITSLDQLSEYKMVFRLTEMYLIRAEAELLGNGDAGSAVSDLNVIRERAGIGDYAGPTDAPSLQKELLRENLLEFFSEYGTRWIELKRTGQIDNVMSVVTPQKSGGAWDTRQQLMPIPTNDMQIDHNLVQNPGY